jgi:hypothetical protein
MSETKYKITCESSQNKPKSKKVLAIVFFVYLIAIPLYFIETVPEIVRYISLGIMIVSIFILVSHLSTNKDIMTASIEDGFICIQLKEDKKDLRIPLTEVTKFDFFDDNGSGNCLVLFFAGKEFKVTVCVELRGIRQENLKNFVKLGMEIKNALQEYREKGNMIEINWMPFLYPYWKF